MSWKSRCLSTSSWLVDPNKDVKPSVVTPTNEGPNEPLSTQSDEPTRADEKVVDYGLRISRKLRAASDNIRENLVPDLVPRALENVAIFALASFTRGLRKDVEERVERQGPKFLETAIDLAIAAEAKIADRAIFDNESAKTFQRVRIINPSNQPPRLCYNCNKPGHLRRDYKADCQGERDNGSP
ncbi:hypothetical protein TKK_0016120 [Trichogramma kaykai]